MRILTLGKKGGEIQENGDPSDPTGDGSNLVKAYILCAKAPPPLPRFPQPDLCGAREFSFSSD